MSTWRDIELKYSQTKHEVCEWRAVSDCQVLLLFIGSQSPESDGTPLQSPELSLPDGERLRGNQVQQQQTHFVNSVDDNTGASNMGDEAHTTNNGAASSQR